MRAHSIHKRCDARQPCKTCAEKGRGAACKYEVSSGNVPPKPPISGPPRDVLFPWSDSSKSGPSHSLSLVLREKSSEPAEQSERQPSRLKLENAVLVPSSGASAADKALGVTECLTHLDAPSFAIIPSIHFRVIPRPLRIPLSLIPPEHVRVSCVAGSDMDMT